MEFDRTNPSPMLHAILDLGERIKILRLEGDLSLPDLADKAGISKSVLFQLETADSPNPSLETLQKIAKALNVTLAALLQKDSVRAKRVMPDRIDDALKEMIGDLRKQKLTANEAALDALYVLQERQGAPKTAKDWRWLYDTIVLKLDQRKK
jgi:transcriptional regulator with XRE-family HTH domain